MNEDWAQREKRIYSEYIGLAPDAEWSTANITAFTIWLAAKRDAIQRDQPWCEAVLNECAIAHIGWNIDNPRGTITHLIDWSVQLALDPAVSESAAKLVAEAAHWKANHADMAKRNALLSQRPDLPVDRIPAHRELVRLQEENARLRDQLAVADDLAAVAAFGAQLAAGNVRLNIIEDATVAPNTIAVDLPGRTVALDVTGMFEADK